MTAHDSLDPRLAALLPPGDVFVDIGCGGGEALDAVSGRYSRAIGIDSSRSRLRRRGHEAAGWQFVEADLNGRLPLPDELATAMLANQVIEHIANPIHLLGEALRVLKPGGPLILTTPNARYLKVVVRLAVHGHGPRTGNQETIDGAWDNGHIHYFTHRDIREMLLAVGFSHVNSRALIALSPQGVGRQLADRFSTSWAVREFLSGNALFVARK